MKRRFLTAFLLTSGLLLTGTSKQEIMAGNGNLKPIPADPGFRGCGSWGFLLQMPAKICSESLSVAPYVWPDGWGLLQILPQAQRDGTIPKNVLSRPRTCQVFFRRVSSCGELLLLRNRTTSRPDLNGGGEVRWGIGVQSD